MEQSHTWIQYITQCGMCSSNVSAEGCKDGWTDGWTDGGTDGGTDKWYWPPGVWFNIKMSYYQYRKSHCGDKTILRPDNGIPYTSKMTSLYWIRAQATLRSKGSINVNTRIWGASLYFTSLQNAFLWYFSVDWNNIPHPVLQFVLQMRWQSCHLISNTNFTADLWSWIKDQQIYNLMETAWRVPQL